MNKTIFLIFLLTAVCGVKAQHLNGVWFAGCNLRIDKNAGVDEFKIDSIYGVEGSILDFTSSETFVIKSVGEKARRGTYKKDSDTVYLNVEDYYWKGIVKNEALTLTLIDSSDYTLELFYKKLTPSKVPENKVITSENIRGTNWKSTFDKGYALVNFSRAIQPELPDKPQAYFSNFYETSATTETGNYQLDIYKRHMFLYLFGRATFSERVIHIGDYTAGTYLGEVFDCIGSANQTITVQRAQWRQTKILDEQELIAQEAALNGRYQFKMLHGSEEGSSEQLISVIAYLELNRDASCSIEAFLTETIDGVAVLRKLDKAGSWELDSSGHFIRLSIDEAPAYFLTIEREESKLELFLNANPWPEEEEFQTVLKFVKH